MLDCLVALCVLIFALFTWRCCNHGEETQTDEPLDKPRKCSCDVPLDVNVSPKGCSMFSGKGRTVPVELICKPSALANYLLKHCRTFTNYSPSVGWTWRSSAFLQSVYEMLWPWSSPVVFVRDHLQLSDGGLVALDWAGTCAHKRRRTSSHSTSPVLLIIPNSFGRITRHVIKLCEIALSHGYLPAVFNHRSHNGTPLTTLKLQQFGDPSDLREAVRYIRYRQPSGKLYAVSESTGSGLLLSYLGECGSSSYVTAAVCLSPVFRCQSWFEKGLCWPLQWMLVLYQKIYLSRYRTALGETLDTDTLFSSCSLRTLEEALFCQRGRACSVTAGATCSTSFCSWDAYWERNEPLRDVDEVAIPVLNICAQDDLVRGETHSTIPLELFHTNPHFFLLLLERGGHCGFSTQSGRCGPVGVSNCRTEYHEAKWSHTALLEFFRATTDFFNAEERANQMAARRRGGPGGVSAGRVIRHRSISSYKRVPACSHNIHDIYNWQRSYTR